MSTIWEPPPEATEIMQQTAKWVARLYGIKITFTLEDGCGSRETVTIDRMRAPQANHA